MKFPKIPLFPSRPPGPAPVHELDLHTSRIAAPLQFTTGGVFAWFVLDSLNWEFRTLEERIGLWNEQTSRWGQMADAGPGVRPIHIRRTTRPFAAFRWAAELDAAANPLPPVPGQPGWDDLLAHGQRRLRSTGLDVKVTMLGVWIAPAASAEAVEDLTVSDEPPRREGAKILSELASLTRLLDGGESFRGRQATPADMGFLMHRSISMGVPATAQDGPREWGPDGMGEFTERAKWFAEPFGDDVEVRADEGGRMVTRHVVTLSMGAMPERVWPESGAAGWVIAGDELGFPIEWSISGALMKGTALESTVVLEERTARAIQEHYDDHGVPVPPAVARGIRDATQTHDEVTEGTTQTRPRLSAAIRAAVYGSTPDEATERAQRLVAHYSDERMTLTRTVDQASALEEFIPGEPHDMKSWTRRMGMPYLASAMTYVDSVVGPPTGAYLGYTALGRRAVLADLHYGPEVLNTSGLQTISGGQGSGKSVALGTLTYQEAMAGVQTVVMDPSGPMSVLTRFPELAPHSRHIKLTRSDPGTLAPHGLIPIPRQENYVGRDGELDRMEHMRAVRAARAERAQLLFDVLRMLLSPALARTPGVDRLLMQAIRSMGSQDIAQRVPETRWNPRWALDRLRAQGSETLGQEICAELEGAADFPGGSLIIPEHSNPLDGVESMGGQTLTVITMPGLEPPPMEIDREHWNPSERYALPLLHLGAFFASQSVYTGGADEFHARKNLFMDESHVLMRLASGRALVVRIGRDSRKRNMGILLSSQDPGDHKQAAGLDALSAGAFVGKLPTEDAARRGCIAAGISEAYVPVILGLQTGEFVYRDMENRVAKIRVDMKWHPSLAALTTTPGKFGKVAPADVPPMIDPRLLEMVEAAA